MMIANRYIKLIRQYGALAGRTRKGYGAAVGALMLAWLMQASPEGASDEERADIVAEIKSAVANEYQKNDATFDVSTVLGFSDT